MLTSLPCSSHMSHLMRKPAFCTYKNKGADQLHGHRTADQCLWFCYRGSCCCIRVLCPTNSQGRNCMYAKTHVRTNLEATLCYEMPYNCFLPGASPPGSPIMVFLSLTSSWGLPPPTSAYSLILSRYAPDS